MHTHMPYATALTVCENGRLEPCEQKALRFYEHIVYDDDYNGVALDNAEGDRIAGHIGRHQAFVTGLAEVAVHPQSLICPRSCHRWAAETTTGPETRWRRTRRAASDRSAASG